jgi:uncharacterized tellurite resistance protein B-like protein
MFNAVRRFVHQHLSSSDGVTPPADAPSGADPVQLAACALLLELAHADGEFSAEEREHIERTLVHHFGLDAAAGEELMKLADAERAQSIDHFQFTWQITANYDLGQKMVLAEVMWGVILADGKLGEHEAYLVRKLARLMELEPAYLSQARRSAANEGRSR